MGTSPRAHLHTNASFAQAVLETIGNLVVVTDREGRVVLFNRACEHLTGYGSDEVEGRRVWDLFFLPEDRERIAAAYQRVLDGKFPNSGEHYWLARDGRQPQIMWSYTAICDPAGPVEYVIGTGHDVTEQRRAEADRSQGLTLMRAVLESSQDAILVLNGVGALVEWNPAAERLFGHARESVLGLRMSDVIIPERLRGSYRAGLAVLKEGGSVHAMGRRTETVGVRSDGSQFPMELALSAWGDGAQLTIVAGIRDLSERDQAETARRSNEAKTRFLAIMSHEFRTPLNSILGFAQLLGAGSGPLAARQVRYVENILSSGRHLLDLINDLLDLTKVQAGQMELQPVSVEVDNALEDLGAKVRPIASAAHLELALHGSSGIRVLADRRRLDQVMLNLLANAIKFTRPGGTVSVRCGRAERGRVEIAVIDTGLGIPLEQQERIFDEFTQVDSDTTRGQAGTGLGLALTQQLVGLMGGDIRVSSVLGQGSTFTISLPEG